MAVQDFNGDGDPDVAVANFIPDNVSVLLGGAGGSFTGPTSAVEQRLGQSVFEYAGDDCRARLNELRMRRAFVEGKLGIDVPRSEKGSDIPVSSGDADDEEREQRAVLEQLGLVGGRLARAEQQLRLAGGDHWIAKKETVANRGRRGFAIPSSIATAGTTAPPTPSWFAPSPDLARAVTLLWQWFSLVAGVTVVIVCASRMVDATATARRALVPVLGPLLAVAATLAAYGSLLIANPAEFPGRQPSPLSSSSARWRSSPSPPGSSGPP